MRQLIDTARDEFAGIFGEEAEFYGCAPGRVIFFGDPADDSGGHALASAIDRGVVIAGRPVAGNAARVYSLTFSTGSSFDVRRPDPEKAEHWLKYIAAVAARMAARGYVPSGFEAVVAGNVPLGAGLGSSTALTMAAAQFIRALPGAAVADDEMTALCRNAESVDPGAPDGILDSLAAVAGAEGGVLLIDRRAEKVVETLALPEDVRLVVADTQSSLVPGGGEGARRRESLLRAVAACATAFPGRGITCLRDVGMDELRECRETMREEDFRLARHLIGENERALAGAEALRRGDAAGLGELLRQSHASCRDDLGNSGHELDAMTTVADGLPDCWDRD